MKHRGSYPCKKNIIFIYESRFYYVCLNKNMKRKILVVYICVPFGDGSAWTINHKVDNRNATMYGANKYSLTFKENCNKNEKIQITTVFNKMVSYTLTTHHTFLSSMYHLQYYYSLYADSFLSSTSYLANHSMYNLIYRAKAD